MHAAGAVANLCAWGGEHVAAIAAAGAIVPLVRLLDSTAGGVQVRFLATSSLTCTAHNGRVVVDCKRAFCLPVVTPAFLVAAAVSGTSACAAVDAGCWGGSPGLKWLHDRTLQCMFYLPLCLHLPQSSLMFASHSKHVLLVQRLHGFWAVGDHVAVLMCMPAGHTLVQKE